MDSGRSVRLFIGDEQDQCVVDEILADIRRQRPDLAPSQVIGPLVTSFPELTTLVSPVATVVAARFHNIVFAVMLGKPTICISYSPKIDSLMSDVGLTDYANEVQSLERRAVEGFQFTRIERRVSKPRVRKQLLTSWFPQRSEQSPAQLRRSSSAGCSSTASGAPGSGCRP